MNTSLLQACIDVGLTLKPKHLEVFSVINLYDSSAKEILYDVNSGGGTKKFKSVVEINQVVGNFGKRVLKLLGGIHPDSRYADHKGYWHVVCTGYPLGRDGDEEVFRWTPRPELFEAMQRVESVQDYD